MDTQQTEADKQRAEEEARRVAAMVAQHIAEIKAYMPETYKAIRAKAAEIGERAYGLVRAGLRDEPDKFWAMERGHVKGTPFHITDIQTEVARHMVQFGCAHVCIFAVPSEGGNHAD